MVIGLRVPVSPCSDDSLHGLSHVTLTDRGIGGGDKVIYGKNDQTFDDSYSVDVLTGYEYAVVANVHGSNTRDDIYFHDEASTPADRIWYGGATRGSFWIHAVSNPPVGVFTINAGDFDGNGHEDLIWHSATSTDYLLRGVATGAPPIQSIDPVPSDRTAIVGQFGKAPGGSNTSTDILWHHIDPAERIKTGPLTGGAWWWDPFMDP